MKPSNPINGVDDALTEAVKTLGTQCQLGNIDQRIRAAEILLKWEASHGAPWVWQERANERTD